MRHIDDLNFELNACLDRAKKTKDEPLVNSLLFCLLTIDELEKTIKSEDKIVAPINTPWAFPVGRLENE
jgi:hypothetical protein